MNPLIFIVFQHYINTSKLFTGTDSRKKIYRLQLECNFYEWNYVKLAIHKNSK